MRYEVHQNHRQEPIQPELSRQGANNAHTEVSSEDDGCMADHLVGQFPDEFVSLAGRVAAVPGYRQVVEYRTVEQEEDNVGVKEALRVEERGEALLHSRMVLLIGSRIHQRVVEQPLRSEEDAESPHSRLNDSIFAVLLEEEHAEPVSAKRNEDVEKGGESDEGAV